MKSSRYQSPVFLECWGNIYRFAQIQAAYRENVKIPSIKLRKTLNSLRTFQILSLRHDSNEFLITFICTRRSHGRGNFRLQLQCQPILADLFYFSRPQNEAVEQSKDKNFVLDVNISAISHLKGAWQKFRLIEFQRKLNGLFHMASKLTDNINHHNVGRHFP